MPVRLAGFSVGRILQPLLQSGLIHTVVPALTARRGGGASAVPRILAANRTQMKTAVTAVTDPFTSRRTHYASPQGNISNLQTVDINTYISDVGTVTAGAAHTIKRYIEYPLGVFTQVTWGGQTTVTLAPGARAAPGVE